MCVRESVVVIFIHCLSHPFSRHPRIPTHTHTRNKWFASQQLLLLACCVCRKSRNEYMKLRTHDWGIKSSLMAVGMLQVGGIKSAFVDSLNSILLMLFVAPTKATKSNEASSVDLSSFARNRILNKELHLARASSWKI